MTEISMLHAVILPSTLINKALALGRKYAKERVEYDFRFEDENGKVYCTGLINECYSDLFKEEYSNQFGKSVLTPDGIFNSQRIIQVLSVKH